MAPRHPNPARYHYPSSLKPHPFMGLNKFNAGQIYQMRSNESYLKAHPSWDTSKPHTCQKCGEAPKTFDHIILSCPAKGPARDRHLQEISDWSPDAPVYSSVVLLHPLSSLFRSMNTAFAPGMFNCPSSAGLLVSSHVSSMVSVGYFLSSHEG